MEAVEEKSNAQENLNTVLGSIGTAGVLGLFGGNGLGGIFGGNRPQPPELATQRDVGYERQLTEKDMEIAQLKAEKYTDAAVLAAERRLADKIEATNLRINALENTQSVLNAHQSDAIKMMQGEIMEVKSVFGAYIRQPIMAASEAALSTFQGKTATAAASGTGN